MDYILDSYALQYLLESFPKKLMMEVWNIFENACNSGNCSSDKEAFNELEFLLTELASTEWLKENKRMFKPLTEKESIVLGELMKKGEFSFYKDSSEFIRQMPVSAPFLIAKAIAQKKTFVIHKSNRYKSYLEKVCKKHKVPIIEVEDFLMDLRLNA